MRLAAFLSVLLLPLLLAPALQAQAASLSGTELANLREDVRLLLQRVGELSLRVEQLETDNTRLSKSAAGAERSFVTLAQLNTAVADLSRDLKAGDAATKTEVLSTVATQMENLARQTNTALDSVTRPRAAAPAAPAAFHENFSKDGISYTVVAGDTISRIAQKTGAKVADIVNANKLADPTKIQVGQVLFVPGGR